MKHLTSLFLFAVMAFVHAQENDLCLSDLGFRLNADLKRWALIKDSGARHEVEIENRNLDYDLNPVAIKRFISIERALLRPMKLKVLSSPQNDDFKPSDVYRGKVSGFRKSDGMLVTVVIEGAGSHIRFIRIHSHSCSEADHQSVLVTIEAQQ